MTGLQLSIPSHDRRFPRSTQSFNFCFLTINSFSIGVPTVAVVVTVNQRFFPCLCVSVCVFADFKIPWRFPTQTTEMKAKKRKVCTHVPKCLHWHLIRFNYEFELFHCESLRSRRLEHIQTPTHTHTHTHIPSAQVIAHSLRLICLVDVKTRGKNITIAMTFAFVKLLDLSDWLVASAVVELKKWNEV